MSKISPRQQKVADQLQRELAVLIQQEVRDPRLGMVSVTSVDVSRDLAYADVYVTALNAARTQRVTRTVADSEAGVDDPTAQTDTGELESDDAAEHSESLEILNRAAGYLRGLLAKRMKLRITPHLRFHYDESIARGRYLSGLIENAVASDRRHNPDDEDGQTRE